jgi:hypothetical protein
VDSLRARQEPLRAWERKALRKIFGAVCEQGEWGIWTDDEVYKLYGELELVAEVKKRRLQYLRQVVRMEEDTRRFLTNLLGAGGNLAGRERDSWMKSPRIWTCLGFEAGRGGAWTGKNGRNL